MINFLSHETTGTKWCSLSCLRVFFLFKSLRKVFLWKRMFSYTTCNNNNEDEISEINFRLFSRRVRWKVYSIPRKSKFIIISGRINTETYPRCARDFNFSNSFIHFTGWLVGCFFVGKWPHTQKCGRINGERERIFITFFLASQHKTSDFYIIEKIFFYKPNWTFQFMIFHNKNNVETIRYFNQPHSAEHELLNEFFSIF